MAVPGIGVPSSVQDRKYDDLIRFGNEEHSERKSADQSPADVMANDGETRRILQDREHGRFDRCDKLSAEAIAPILIPLIGVAQVGLCLGAYE